MVRRPPPSWAVGRLGRASAWAARWPAHARGRDGALGRAARCGPMGRIRFLIFQRIEMLICFFVMNPTSINHSKLHGCPKIVKLSLLGSQKCHLPVSIVSSQLTVMIIGS